MSAVLTGPLERGGASNRALNYAVAASLLFHTALLAVFSMERQAKKQDAAPGPIVARLVAPPAAVQPVPVPPQPEPPKPRAEEPRPIAPPVKPAPVQKAAPTPAPAKSESTTPAVGAASPPAPPASPPSTAPAPTAPSVARADPQPDSSASADDPDRKMLIASYGIQLKSQMRKYNRYPRIALDNNWEGKGELLLLVGANGMISEIRVIRSTGHEILDKTMAETVRKAKPLVPIPPSLRGREFSIEIPYEWVLKDAR